MSLVVGFKCDGSERDATEPCGGSTPCEKIVTRVERGSCYIGANDAAKDLQGRLESQGWRFLGGYCYCPTHG